MKNLSRFCLINMTVWCSLLLLSQAEEMESSEATPENEEESDSDYKEPKIPDPEKANPQSSVSNFRKNELNPSNLKGARWELEISKPTDVYFCIEIRDISQISVTNSDFRLDLHVKQRWYEDSLSVPPGLFLDTDLDDTFITTDGEVLNDVWTPDLFIPNARTALVQSINHPQKSVRIYKNKTIIYSSNMFAILGCPMEFRWYPLDSQHCKLVLESFTYTNDKVTFHWEHLNPVVLPKNFRLRQYLLQIPLPIGTEIRDRFGRNDTYSRLIVYFTLQRELAHHLIQVFIPTFLIVALSWFSFWLGLDAIPGRVSLLVTCMLTLVTMYSGLKQDLPPVSYIKMLDIWMAVCMGFVFAAMFEFIIARYIWYTQKKSNEHKDQHHPHPKTFEANRRDSKVLWRIGPNPYDEFYRHPKHPRNRRIFHQAWEIPADTEIINFDHVNYNNKANNGRITRRGEQVWGDEAPPYQPYSHYPEEYMRNPYNNSQPKKQYNNHEIHYQKGNKERAKPLKDWEILDKISRIAFPILFAFFLGAYWPILFFASGPNNK